MIDSFSACPPTFASYRGSCYRNIDIAMDMETQESRSVCERMSWGTETAHHLVLHDFDEQDFKNALVSRY